MAFFDREFTTKGANGLVYLLKMNEKQHVPLFHPTQKVRLRNRKKQAKLVNFKKDAVMAKIPLTTQILQADQTYTKTSTISKTSKKSKNSKTAKEYRTRPGSPSSKKTSRDIYLPASSIPVDYEKGSETPSFKSDKGQGIDFVNHKGSKKGKQRNREKARIFEGQRRKLNTNDSQKDGKKSGS